VATAHTFVEVKHRQSGGAITLLISNLCAKHFQVNQAFFV